MENSNTMSGYASTIMFQKYSQTKIDGSLETWPEISYRVAKNVLGAVKAPKSQIDATAKLISERKFIPGGRYLYASGRPFHQVQNCLLLRAEDSREGWANLLQKSAMALMTGAGIGIDYSSVRPRGSVINRTGGLATGPISLMEIVNCAGRGIMQGGSRRSAIWAGLKWWHKDIFEFIGLKNWPSEVRALKAKDFNFPASMDGTNISVQLDPEFIRAYHDSHYVCSLIDPNDPDKYKHVTHKWAKDVYDKTVRQALETGEPGFSFDEDDETLRNACTEIVSSDDSDICNLGSINMAQINSLDEMKETVRLGTLFLLAGTLYSDVPYQRVAEIREKNRRLGLGLMGIHEWLLKRGKQYGPDGELAEYLEVYATSTSIASNAADVLGISRPIKTRAIAPTGTIGIMAETSGGLEPIFCIAYKRRYLDGLTWKFQYVMDPVAKRLIDSGVDPEAIEDAYALAKEPERRVAFQAWLQKYVDHGISSTLNLPEWGSEWNNESRVKEFGKMLIKYLPQLRGFTCYPDGCRDGQPFNVVSYKTAMKHKDEVFMEQMDLCSLTGGGSCGS